MSSLEMQRIVPRLLSIIVVETGAPWPIPELTDDELEIDRVVLAQQLAEDQLGFADRVAARLGALAEHGAAVRLGVIAIHEDESLVAMESRERIGRALIALRTRDRTAGLMLIGRSSRGPRHGLFALAGSLCRGLHDDLYVRVKMVKAEARVRRQTPKTRLSA